MTMEQDWQQFEAWLRTHWRDGLADLNPPATDAQIAALESALGVSLPREFVACLQVHNGQSGSAGGLFDNAEFLSTDAILEQWTVWKELLDAGEFDGITSEPGAGVRNNWWNPRWIPFTHDGGGNHSCVDLNPAQGGTVGQVVAMWHDAGERERLATSFDAWFRGYVADVLAGQYVFSDEYGGLVHVDDA